MPARKRLAEASLHTNGSIRRATAEEERQDWQKELLPQPPSPVFGSKVDHQQKKEPDNSRRSKEL
jgi:hypothetical protein